MFCRDELSLIFFQWFFFSWKMRIVLKRMKNHFSHFLQYLIFELWLILYSNFTESFKFCEFNNQSIISKNFVPKDAQCSEKNAEPNFRFRRFSDLDDCLRTWFRNANQWYPITRWLGGFNRKHLGPRGGAPSEGCQGHHFFSTFQMILNKKKFVEHKIISFTNFFSAQENIYFACR